MARRPSHQNLGECQKLEGAPWLQGSPRPSEERPLTAHARPGWHLWRLSGTRVPLAEGTAGQGLGRFALWQQHGGQGSGAHPRSAGRPQACRGGQLASRCDVHSTTLSPIARPRSLSGTRERWPSSFGDARPGRWKAQPHAIYRTTVSHCLPVRKGQLKSGWLASRDLAGFGEQLLISVIISSLFFHLGSKRLNL